MRRIASRDNPHYKALKRLSESGRERRRSGRVLLDGMHLLETYRQRCGEPDEVLVGEGGATRPEIARYLEGAAAATNITVLADPLFAGLAMVDAPSGIMAVVRLPQPARMLDHDADAVLLDGLQDPGNVGSILRSAAAAGFRQVLLSADCAQVWSPKVLRAAMGAHFQIDLHESADLADFLAAYRGQAVATSLAASRSLYEAELRAAVAWVFGSEGSGVRPSLLAATRQHLRIPMPGGSESLNVAAAAAICLFETVRRRTGTPGNATIHEHHHASGATAAKD
ncbi:MAG TPA: RNA methyltransferase [Accumulibacter sp.]|uniref:TrmH family RNA methyltransferase n=1 Tax=Accumulibacter sp. TaxID=2053492 RepID=UPI0025F08FA3|nr:RNA methyltransferase [Accumulibacter sp.]MCM8600302.1 RNA methyltransferase [Accumulibacter sp.]MCM8664535.1 RNA methyltransferase [Accumulibacter sp.]HNC51447.1 RNA methyltransferase [Accumulibacter sp.]